MMSKMTEGEANNLYFKGMILLYTLYSICENLRNPT